MSPHRVDAGSPPLPPPDLLLPVLRPCRRYRGSLTLLSTSSSSCCSNRSTTLHSCRTWPPCNRYTHTHGHKHKHTRTHTWPQTCTHTHKPLLVFGVSLTLVCVSVCVSVCVGHSGSQSSVRSFQQFLSDVQQQHRRAYSYFLTPHFMGGCRSYMFTLSRVFLPQASLTSAPGSTPSSRPIGPGVSTTSTISQSVLLSGGAGGQGQMYLRVREHTCNTRHPSCLTAVNTSCFLSPPAG